MFRLKDVTIECAKCRHKKLLIMMSLIMTLMLLTSAQWERSGNIHGNWKNKNAKTVKSLFLFLLICGNILSAVIIIWKNK